ncbi:hypothetical protein FE257_008310 [Aspergillus nanangensis]|uniref:Uncharacterized protein n=1 Tax=Aspergillus nanangensis TaxID=2582783 RepID=A0AAD4CLH9_ASPNN|nr:hypothetical protein FE257_008310 [Aspergillus nanangensis]
MNGLDIEPQDSHSWVADWDQPPSDRETTDTRVVDPSSQEKYTSDFYQTIPLLDDWDGSQPHQSPPTSNETGCREGPQRPSGDSPFGPFRQTKPTLCTRLQSYRDIRLGVQERWAMQEGSLVISIDPSFTLLDRERRSDEFELTSGDVYIVCLLYADLWTLCYKVPFTSDTGTPSRQIPAVGSGHYGFLPLCAVTLVTNFGFFARRCCEYVDNLMGSEPRYPGNGLSVMPPPRSHSLNGSIQVFQGHNAQVRLPEIAHDALASGSLDDNTDFVPLDSTLEQVLAKLDCRHRMWHAKVISMRRIQEAARSYHDRSMYRSSYRTGSSDTQMSGFEGRYHLRRGRGSSSSASEKLRSFFKIS